MMAISKLPKGKKMEKYWCNCQGCRGYARGNSLYRNYWQGLISELNGNYFSPSNRKFHGSRITGWRYIYQEGSPDIYGVAIKETRKAGWDGADGREYAVSIWCRYGEILESVRQENARAANKFLESAEILEKIQACLCHGCSLDRQGRK
jgi:hypothetical protein